MVKISWGAGISGVAMPNLVAIPPRLHLGGLTDAHAGIATTFVENSDYAPGIASS